MAEVPYCHFREIFFEFLQKFFRTDKIFVARHDFKEFFVVKAKISCLQRSK